MNGLALQDAALEVLVVADAPILEAVLGVETNTADPTAVRDLL